MKILLIALLLFSGVTAAQNTNTICQRIGNQVYCNSNTPEWADSNLLNNIANPYVPHIITPYEMRNEALQRQLMEQQLEMNQLQIERLRQRY
jgi:hypothetical protein